MRLSRATIVAPVPETGQALLVQPLSGQVALLDEENARRLRDAGKGGELSAGLPLDDLRAGRFAVDSEDEERQLVADAYAEYLAELDRTPTQLVIVPSFGCNLSCTYCFQEAFEPEAGLVRPETIDALFAYVDRFHGAEDPKPYLTLFGGEPLLDTPPHRARVGALLDGARARGLEVAAVTNGYDLEAYLPLLAAGPVKEVQVTIDGPQALHDRRRPHARGGGTFERVARGVDLLLAAGVPVNLRVVADRENLPALPELAALAEARGWLEKPERLFKTQVGRNYELFGCASGQRREQLYGRVELWADYAALAERHPILRRFHAPRLHGMRHLAETGEWPAPNFDSCPATKKEWAFAPDGGLYGCTATVGNPRHRLGRYAPRIERDEAAIARWSDRNVFSIPACRGCELAPVCGGGCGALAERTHLDILAPDCRPVRELVGLGARYYGLAG